MDLATISTGNPKIDHLLGILGIVVTVSSAAASFINGKIRAAIDAEGEAPTLFLWMGLVLNYLAFNADKAVQIQKLLRGQSVTVIKVNHAPAAPAQPSAEPPPPVPPPEAQP